MKEKLKIPVEKLRKVFNVKARDMKKYGTLDEECGIVGQDRAISALKTGLDLHSKGYNVFVCGMPGTGRTTAVKKVLKTVRSVCEKPDDFCYVFNFKDADQPKLLRMPNGTAVDFKKDQAELIEHLKKQIPSVFEADTYAEKREALADKFRDKEKELFEAFEAGIKKDDFVLAQLRMGQVTAPEIFPVIDEKPVQLSDLQALVEQGKLVPEKAELYREKYKEHRPKLIGALKKARGLARKLNEELKELANETADNVLQSCIEDLLERYPYDPVKEYISQVHGHVLDNLSNFRERDSEAKMPPGLPGMPMREEVDPFLVYEVNVILDNKERGECPIVFEKNPTFWNLFGTIEISPDGRGRLKTDFTHIKGGSLLQADCGYLIINALDLLQEPGVWPMLKRVLKNRELSIQFPQLQFQLFSQAIKPEPIDVRVKVILIGDPNIYNLLFNLDDDFRKIFKVKADFDTRMTASTDAIHHFINVAMDLGREENLLSLSPAALGEVVEYGFRIAGGRDKITTRFSEIADILRESSFIARKRDAKKVSDVDVQKTLDARRDRKNLVESKISESIEKGVILVDTEGARVGVVNGLAVYQSGDYAFGQPSRITAAVAMGRAGIINIEREANLSGAIHDKGVLILTGFLRERFARDKPLNLSGSICFEQSYGGVDGDSASSTEIYALLSALSGIPIKQNLAVTGSVNQKGEIQPIGGVNEKIEGFFDVCNTRGLTGDQGVLIPVQNVDELMLKQEVVEAVKKGLFHIYRVAAVEEGIQLLTDTPAGELGPDGYPSDSVYGRADAKLRDLAYSLRKFERSDS